MKKHVSLFLALLMVVSMFFAFPAEAEALEQTRMEQSPISILNCSLFPCPTLIPDP